MKYTLKEKQKSALKLANLKGGDLFVFVGAPGTICMKIVDQTSPHRRGYIFLTGGSAYFEVQLQKEIMKVDPVEPIVFEVCGD